MREKPEFLSGGRPCEGRDPYSVPYRWAAAYGSRLCGRRSASKTRVTALTGTTGMGTR
jgi:hypothetical protein